MASKIGALAPCYMPQFCAKCLILITSDDFHISHFGIELNKERWAFAQGNRIKIIILSIQYLIFLCIKPFDKTYSTSQEPIWPRRVLAIFSKRLDKAHSIRKLFITKPLIIRINQTLGPAIFHLLFEYLALKVLA